MTLIKTNLLRDWPDKSSLDIYPRGVYSIFIMDNGGFKGQAERRINIIKGQLDGLFKMIDKDEYCTDILDQSLAIQNSLKSLNGLILERHLRIHAADQFKNNKEKAVNELLKIFKKKQRND